MSTAGLGAAARERGELGQARQDGIEAAVRARVQRRLVRPQEEEVARLVQPCARAGLRDRLPICRAVTRYMVAVCRSNRQLRPHSRLSASCARRPGFAECKQAGARERAETADEEGSRRASTLTGQHALTKEAEANQGALADDPGPHDATARGRAASAALPRAVGGEREQRGACGDG